jgi:hypothetical protein
MAVWLRGLSFRLDVSVVVDGLDVVCTTCVYNGELCAEYL